MNGLCFLAEELRENILVAHSGLTCVCLGTTETYLFLIIFHELKYPEVVFLCLVNGRCFFFNVWFIRWREEGGIYCVLHNPVYCHILLKPSLIAIQSCHVHERNRIWILVHCSVLMCTLLSAHWRHLQFTTGMPLISENELHSSISGY